MISKIFRRQRHDCKWLGRKRLIHHFQRIEALRSRKTLRGSDVSRPNDRVTPHRLRSVGARSRCLSDCRRPFAFFANRRKPQTPLSRTRRRMPNARRNVVAFLQHEDFVFSRTDRQRGHYGRPSRHGASEIRAFIASIRFWRMDPDLRAWRFRLLGLLHALQEVERWKFPATLSSAPTPPSACVPVPPAFLCPAYPPTIPSIGRTDVAPGPVARNGQGLRSGGGCGNGFWSDHARRKEMPCHSSSPES